MLKNTLINRVATRRIALALGELNARVVYVGGAVVSLYIDDPAADDVRPTKDIDITMEIADVGELESIRVALVERGFHQTHEDTVICRFRYGDTRVDVMSTKTVGWAPSNPWFDPGFRYTVQFVIDGVGIRCLSLPYFLATKFTAFLNRGATDPRTSKDFEDIVYILNHTSDVALQILQAGADVRHFLAERSTDILNDSHKQEAVLAHLHHEHQTVRYGVIMERLRVIAKRG
jgi:hypothetical protein